MPRDQPRRARGSTTDRGQASPAATARDQRGQRRIAEDRRHREPDRERRPAPPARQGEQHAERVATPLPPRNPSQTGNMWPRHRAPRGRAPPRRPIARRSAPRRRPCRRRRPGSARQRLAAGAQHVGRADIARADLRGCRPARRAGSATGRTGSSPADSRSTAAAMIGGHRRSAPALENACGRRRSVRSTPALHRAAVERRVLRFGAELVGRCATPRRGRRPRDRPARPPPAGRR